ncbi:MAG: hypothetical protein CM15mP49_29070 [Actinomycetota bacterium]|nr:MAG: hypothetical protein CM15mP49_29070 [Actinomycetota bacterium]
MEMMRSRRGNRQRYIRWIAVFSFAVALPLLLLFYLNLEMKKLTQLLSLQRSPQKTYSCELSG